MKHEAAILYKNKDREADERDSRDEGVMHNNDLFDENDDGKEVDESSGKPWDTSGGRGNDEELDEVDDPNPPDECAGDEADQWLERHG